MEKTIVFAAAFSCLISSVWSLSCYTCNHQDWNWGLCTTTTVQCAPFQDACTSYTSYQLPLRYTPRADRYLSISKGCDTQEGCARRKDALDLSTCSRSSYDDWSCVECCIGDLCNFYITLDARSIHGSLLIVLIAMAAQYLMRQL